MSWHRAVTWRARAESALEEMLCWSSRREGGGAIMVSAAVWETERRRARARKAKRA
jgi:hypothetical protein